MSILRKACVTLSNLGVKGHRTIVVEISSPVTSWVHVTHVTCTGDRPSVQTTGEDNTCCILQI